MSPGPAALQTSRPSNTIDLTAAPPRTTTLKHQMAAIVKLNSIDTDDKVGCRRLVLTTDRPICPIGRASSKKAGLEGRVTNAYFENAVISRVHAELRLDLSGLRVMLADKGSLHGTLHNDTRLKIKETRALRTGDTITLGAPIERGQDKFQPYKIRAEITWEMPSTDKPVTWTVPDDTDVEDLEEDGGNDTDLSFAQSVLAENGFEAPCSPAFTEAASTSHGQGGTVVDLTTDEGPAEGEGTEAPAATTVTTEEPDLYSDDRVPVIKDVPAHDLWDNENENEDNSEDLYAEEWGAATESADVDGGDGCSICNSELASDAGTDEIDLDGESAPEAYPDSSVASFEDDCASDKESSDWGDYESLMADMHDGASTDSAPDRYVEPTTTTKLDQISLPIPLPEMTHTTSLEQHASFYVATAPQNYGTSSLSKNFAPICPSGGENDKAADKLNSSTFVPSHNPSNNGHLNSAEENISALVQRRTFFSKILSDVDPIISGYPSAQVAAAAPPTECTDFTASAEPATHIPESPSRKRAADMMSTSTPQEEEIVGQAQNAGSEAENAPAEPATLREEPSSVAQPAPEPAQKLNVATPVASTERDQHTAKRTRRSVAEAAGYVALGGVLAWSALIATAPVL